MNVFGRSVQMFLPILTIIYCCFGAASSYNVLITVAGVSGSQNLVMYRLADLLSQKGNNVTLLRSVLDPDAKTPKLTCTNITEITYSAVSSQEEVKLVKAFATKKAFQDDIGSLEMLSFMPKVFKLFLNICVKLLENEEVMNQLKRDNYDVVVIHIMEPCNFGLAHLLGIKGTIWFSTAFFIDFMAAYSGAPSPTSYVPTILPEATDKMTLAQRMQNTALGAVLRIGFCNFMIPKFTAIYPERYGPEFPPIDKLLEQTDLYFINADPFFEYPRPILHNVIYVGGLTMQKVATLSKDWKQITGHPAAKKHGIVVFSFGTVANTTEMPFKMKVELFNAFRKLEQLVIVRIEGDVPDVSDKKNIKIVSWIPQKDLLAHPDIKLFITHGGYNSITEATFLGVPMVTIPLFGDQPANSKRVENAGIGLTLDKTKLTEQNIYEAVTTVLNDRSYLERSKRLAQMIQKKPQSSASAAVGWIEFLAEFKELPELRPASLQLNFAQYFLLDALLLVSSICLSISAIFIFIIYKLCRCWKRRQSKKQVSKKKKQK